MLCATSIDSQSFEDSGGYLSSTQRNYSELACDGELLSMRCPPRSTISVQSAFYGRRASIPLQCVHSNDPTASAHSGLVREDLYCAVQTALQKVLDECQDRRSCHLVVSGRVFGTDPCPTHSKYLIVWYKCRPNDYRTKVVCEGERIRLSCRRGTLIAVSSATFEGLPRATHKCPPTPPSPPAHLGHAGDCQSLSSVQAVASHCHGKGSCSFLVSSQEFGEACSPGYHNYLSIIYTCVLRRLLEETHERLSAAHLLPQERFSTATDDTPPDGPPPPLLGNARTVRRGKQQRESGVYAAEDTTRFRDLDEMSGSTLSPDLDTKVINKEMAIISNALAACSFIADHPERAALYFVCGICLGLVVTLLALVVQISCRTDCRARRVPRNRKPGKTAAVEPGNSSTSESESDWDTTSDLSARRHRRFERTLNTNVFTSAEELERAQRLEERERIIREIWMNGQPDIPGTRSLNRYY
ncbi:hypothetical protein AALO_G00247850 [Alosa alosa]|uniref:SUEL-type lectin domain-containing protein n=1 Tax=Alosa alosa TaxID=278164 RepID=A0AAV6FVX6_9TELE|nr:hypothetical protein AALO_G00247850 [Alosa alosa]